MLDNLELLVYINHLRSTISGTPSNAHFVHLSSGSEQNRTLGLKHQIKDQRKLVQMSSLEGPAIFYIYTKRVILVVK